MKFICWLFLLSFELDGKNGIINNTALINTTVNKAYNRNENDDTKNNLNYNELVSDNVYPEGY